MGLSKEQIERYSRNILLTEVGEEGQKKLLAGRVLLIGAGGLGSSAGMYLAATGVGTIGVVDGDKVDLSNLQRQIMHTTADIGRPKVLSAAEAIAAINGDVNVRTYEQRLTVENALSIIRNHDFVIDATDNFPSKFLVADACHVAGIPYSHAGIMRFEGQTLTVMPGKTTCYRCIFNAPPEPGAVPSSAEVGVPGVLPGVIGTIQATEAIKFLIGVGDLLTNRLLVYDALKMKFRCVEVSRNDNCPLCGSNSSIRRLQKL